MGRNIWVVIYHNPDTNKYEKRPVREGDWAIAIRPPSLSVNSLQLVKIGFWNKTCMAISPDILKAFSGDYDGDEMHLYLVYSEQAVRECRNWSPTPNRTFERARSVYKSSNIPNKRDEPYGFIYHTTMSFIEVQEGAEQPLCAEETRTKKEHLIGFKDRYNVDEVSNTFLRQYKAWETLLCNSCISLL